MQVDPLATETQAGAAWLGRLKVMERRLTRVVKQLEADVQVDCAGVTYVISYVVNKGRAVPCW
jgi:hypothetical protein